MITNNSILIDFIGFVAWALATVFTVGLLVFKKWLGKKCDRFVDPNDPATPNTTNDPTIPTTDEPSTPTTITIEPTTLTTNEPTTSTLIYDDDLRGMHTPPPHHHHKQPPSISTDKRESHPTSNNYVKNVHLHHHH